MYKANTNLVTYLKKNRVKLFRVDYDKEVIQAIKTRIEECREYYNELKAKLTLNVEQ